MSLDDLLEPEVLIVAGVTAAVASPPVRKVLRKGAVYGLAGLLILGDKLKGVAQGVKQGAQNMMTSASNTAQGATPQTTAPANA